MSTDPRRPVVVALPTARADLLARLDECARELAAARTDLIEYQAYRDRNRLPVDESVIAGLVASVQRAVRHVDKQRAALAVSPAVAAAVPAGPDDAVSAGEVVLRFGRSTLTYVRGALDTALPDAA